MIYIMNARRIHRPRFQREIEAAGSRIARLSPALRVPGTTCGLLDVREGQTTAAQPTRSNTMTTYPRLHRRLWSAGGGSVPNTHRAARPAARATRFQAA